MKGLLLTFYVFLFGGILLFIGTETISQLQPISKWHTAGNLILLALIPTVVSNLALVRAVKSIGSTLTSVLGAMEPVTAVCVGIFLFGGSLHHKHWCRYCTDYRCRNRYYIKTIKMRFHRNIYFIDPFLIPE